jgi:hypothetical protein
MHPHSRQGTASHSRCTVFYTCQLPEVLWRHFRLFKDIARALLCWGPATRCTISRHRHTLTARPYVGPCGAGQGMWPRLWRCRPLVRSRRSTVPACGVRGPGAGLCTQRRADAARQPPAPGELCRLCSTLISARSAAHTWLIERAHQRINVSC